VVLSRFVVNNYLCAEISAPRSRAWLPFLGHALLLRIWIPRFSKVRNSNSDEVWSIQLDEGWLRDPHLYAFPHGPLKDKSVIEQGQTRYTFQLREEPLGGTPWYLEADDIQKVSEAIQRTYTLLLIRNPNIQIFFRDLKNPIRPLEDLYDFSGTNKNGTDLRPQQIQFVFQLLHDGAPYNVTAEVVLGCRRTSSAGHALSGPGIDLAR